MKIRTVVAFTAFLVASLVSRPAFAADPASQSEAERLQNLEKAVRQLQERNAELEKEVHDLKAKGGPFAPMLTAPEPKAKPGAETKAVFTAPSPPPVDVHPAGSE